MKAEDIKGLSPAQIQAKYALPYKPVYVREVKLNAGDTIRMGQTAPNFGFQGDGLQFDLQQQWIGDFTEISKIIDWR